MNITIIVQARTSSSRLPEKVLAPICGEPMIGQQLMRLCRVRNASRLVVATTDSPEDDILAEVVNRYGADVYRGEKMDVLARYVGAARLTKADIIVRVTGDCPLVDPQLIEFMIEHFSTECQGVDYASSTVRRTFPRGLDVEIFHADVLMRTSRLAESKAAREHVTLFMHSERPDLYKMHSFEDVDDNSDLRWTVDTPTDYAYMCNLYETLELNSKAVSYREMISAVRENPSLMYRDNPGLTWQPPSIPPTHAYSRSLWRSE